MFITDYTIHLNLQIVDSIMALFRVDFSGRGELADRQQKLAQLLSRLQKIAEGTLIVIIVSHILISPFNSICNSKLRFVKYPALVFSI